ncbi:MAG: hypothetical protein KBS79_03420 [Lachnospiraceae bacterium]|nr:hypothetical protein [Candidatus Minthocola equi]
MKKILTILKKEPMLAVSLAAAIIALFITPPSRQLISDIDWKTLAILFMMLTVLEGFKKEDLFMPIIRLSSHISSIVVLSLFVVFGVFFSSMFVTNDVSLIIFVPLTIILFRACDKEKYILPVISMENIAAIRGSMLMPFGSPQNLFLFGKSGVSVGTFILHMAPLSIFSAILLVIYVTLLYRKDKQRTIDIAGAHVIAEWKPERRRLRIVYFFLFVIIILTIVTRTTLWPYITAAVLAMIIIFDREVLAKTDYVLILTFLCFFVFSSSIAANPTISAFLSDAVAEHEYWWGILLSQLISNVPAGIVLYPFTTNLSGLLYGLDTAGLCSLIGSLASVINYRIYVKEYPGNGGKFIKVFTIVSLIFFAVVALPGYFLSAWRI